MPIVSSEKDLEHIIAPDMRQSAMAALKEHSIVELYTSSTDSGQTVQTLVVDGDRAGQWTGGTTAWGEWDKERRGVRPDDEPSMLLTLNGNVTES